MMAAQRSRISFGQKVFITEFMEAHPDFVRGNLTPTFTAAIRNQLWEDLARGLNADGLGGVKSVQGWKTSWKELKKAVKEKAAKIKVSIEKTGGGFAKANPLTPLEERIAALIGRAGIHGLANTIQSGSEALVDIGVSQPLEASVIMEAPLFVNGAGFISDESGAAVHLPVPQQPESEAVTAGSSETSRSSGVVEAGILAAAVTVAETCRPRNKKRRANPPLVELEAASSSMLSLASAQRETTAAIARLAASQEAMVELKRQKLQLDRERTETEKDKVKAINNFNEIFKIFLEHFKP